MGSKTEVMWSRNVEDGDMAGVVCYEINLVKTDNNM